MVLIDDILDELYALDNYHWDDSVSRILMHLNFPVIKEYWCDWEEFVYIYSNKLKSFSCKDRKTIAKCEVIASYTAEDLYQKVKLFAIKFNPSTKNLRNDEVHEITKLFRKMYGQFVILIFIDKDELAFSGTALNERNKYETIISDWFAYKRAREINNRILEIDFSLPMGKSISEFYASYLWGIARPYIKYRESKMFLTYGCDTIISDEILVLNQDMNQELLVQHLNIDETYLLNSNYYKDIYKEDYFVDDENADYASNDSFHDEDEIEFEWTMLEMKLEAESLEDEPFSFLENENGTYDVENDYTDDLSGLNPEEMLEYIHGEESINIQ